MKPAKTLHFIWESHKGLFNFIYTKLPVMLKSTVFFMIAATTMSLFAQAPGFGWDNAYRGNGIDRLFAMDKTLDDGLILGVMSTSNISFDKNENHIGGFNFDDYWIIKTDADGLIEWQNTIGSNSIDNLTDIKSISDGGFLVAGFTVGGVSGDKTENVIGGGCDMWILKLDAAGNMLWQNTIGSNRRDYVRSIQETTDGGFILGGNSESKAAFDKTQNNRDTLYPFTNDFWIVKTDASGNVLWDKTIGGSNEEILYSIEQTSDGEYILGGTSLSGISGAKSEPNMGIAGTTDYYIIKLDASGDIIWQQTIGGIDDDELRSVKQTTDGGYLIAGYSESILSGDKTENNFGGIGGNDYWVMKLDASGNILWQNTIGGTLSDLLYTALINVDGDFILGGISMSGISGDKLTDNMGIYDYWLVKIDAFGNVIWEKTIGGSNNDYLHTIVESNDGNYFLGGYSDSGASGYKTEDNIGSYTDAWLVKLQMESCAVPTTIETNAITQTKTTVFWDMNVWASNYQIYYRALGAPVWSKKNAASNIVQLKSLTPGTTYQYKVRTKCENLIFSEFSAIQNFTTLPLRENIMNERSFIPVFPNPSTEEITLSTEFNFSDASVFITDVLGKEILYQNIFNAETTINIKDITSGMYIIQFTIDGITSTQKFIKQ